MEQLPHLAPLAALYRVARSPDPWAPPDWAFAADGEPANRYDDPERYYCVLYAGTSRYACFVETLARFRLNIQLYADLNAIEGEDDYLPLGSVPAAWSRTRCVGVRTSAASLPTCSTADGSRTCACGSPVRACD